MGDFADMAFDTWDEFGDDWEVTPSRKPLKCNHCNKGSLSWRNINKTWVMIEKKGNVHSCHGYEPPLEILKEIVKETLANKSEESFIELYEKTKKRGGLKKIIAIISDKDLLDLYSCFLRDEQLAHDCPEVGWPFSYGRQIEILKEELLFRMQKINYE